MSVNTDIHDPRVDQPPMNNPAATPYAGLLPDLILDAVESLGYRADGGLLALNSYENRVYQIGIEDAPPLIAKFYRPQRWSDAAIQEEHDFSLALEAEEIPVVAPLVNAAGQSLHSFAGYRFALFPRRGGRWPDLDDPDHLAWLGRYLGRVHQLGAVRPFQHRPTLAPETLGTASVRFLLESGWVPVELRQVYLEVTKALLATIDTAFGTARGYRPIRLHGDCHPGNILWTPNGPHFVDLDDAVNGPAIQDLWMLLSGERHERALQLSFVLEGYQLFADFDPRQLGLIEPLRSLRMIHYAAWLARRWDDPAFPTAFPWFATTQYWQDHINSLEHQLAILAEPPLPLI